MVSLNLYSPIMKRRNFLTNFSLGWATTWLGAMLAAFYNGIIDRQGSGTANASTPTTVPTAKSTGMATPTPKSTAMGSPTPTNKASTTGFVKAGTVKDLDQKGSLTLKGNKEAAVIVRDPKNTKTLYAVNSSCTHKGCTVKWETDSKELVCPCHSSAFMADGSVAKGPASKPLKRYEAKIEGADVLIKWS
jgi:cytochrome b6-f complex iron-sulfur subunit